MSYLEKEMQELIELQEKKAEIERKRLGTRQLQDIKSTISEY